ncbi:MAG TPA: hypothetical protein VGI43_02010 [Mucilaginibacter sp.]|jgi:hypothetical protein
MERELITYQKFNDIALANELAQQLDSHHIENHIVEESRTFDPGFTFNDTLQTDWAVKIKQQDFEKVNQLLKDDETEDINAIGKDYYLFGFTDDELMEVITKADEWSPFDFVLARKILANRGKPVGDEAIATINEKRIEELKSPDEPQTYWIIIGYICAFLGGLLGIFIGWFLATYKKTLPNGERVYEYNENDRKQGRRMMYIGIVVLVIAAIYKLSSIFE